MAATQGVHSGRETAQQLSWGLRFRYLARTTGLPKLAVVTVDGSKILANTSKHKAMSGGGEGAFVCSAFNLRRLMTLATAAA